MMLSLARTPDGAMLGSRWLACSSPCRGIGGLLTRRDYVEGQAARTIDAKFTLVLVAVATNRFALDLTRDLTAVVHQKAL